MKPKLIHPQRVQIVHFDSVETVFDPVFNEPIKVDTGNPKKYSEPVVYKAQLNLKKFGKQNMSKGGDTPQYDGYIIIQEDDRAADGLPEIEVESRIVGIAALRHGDFEEVDLKIVEVKPQGHYEKSHLTFCYFIDEQKGDAARKNK